MDYKQAGLFQDLLNYIRQKLFGTKPTVAEEPTTPEVTPETEVPIEPVVTEGVPTPEVLPEATEVQIEQPIQPVEVPKEFIEWIPPLPEDYNPKNDNSYNTFRYLQSLGYTQATWFVSESHPKIDICDNLVSNTFTLEQLLLSAKYDPPSPIYTLTHPSCRCYLTCTPPTGPETIPDNAPGLPLHGIPDEILEYKKLIFNNLTEMPVDSQTLAPTSTKLTALFSSTIKFGILSRSWKKDIQPVITHTDFSLKLPLGLYRPMLGEYRGFRIQKLNKLSKVYFVELNRVVEVPVFFTKELRLDVSESKKVSRGSFVYIDQEDSIGIIYRMFDNGTILCYMPELDSIISTQKYILLDVV